MVCLKLIMTFTTIDNVLTLQWRTFALSRKSAGRGSRNNWFAEQCRRCPFSSLQYFWGSSSSTTPWWQSWVIEQSPSNASKGSPFLKCVGSISWDFFSSRMSLFLKSWCPFWRTFYDERVDFIGSSGLSRLALWNLPVFEEKISFFSRRFWVTLVIRIYILKFSRF